MSKLAEFDSATEALARNQLLFGWLADDEERAQLYRELRDNAFPVLRFKSLLRQRRDSGWSLDDVYFVSRRDQVEAALKHYSVEPYSKLGSGGRFMLGLDDAGAHDSQRAVAAKAMYFEPEEIAACAAAAYRRASIRPLKSHCFDVSDLAEQAALDYMTLLFGLREEAHGVLQLVMTGAYRALVYQIIGRHFVPASEAGLPPPGSFQALDFQKRLGEEILIAAQATGHERYRAGAPAETVIRKLFRDPGGLDVEMLKVVVTGLIAGTIGNVRAAVPIALYHFFTRNDASGRPLIDAARRAARGDGAQLGELITAALLRNPPAAFLARTSRAVPNEGSLPMFTDETGSAEPFAEGAHVLLAMGADPNRSFRSVAPILDSCISALASALPGRSSTKSFGRSCCFRG